MEAWYVVCDCSRFQYIHCLHVRWRNIRYSYARHLRLLRKLDGLENQRGGHRSEELWGGHWALDPNYWQRVIQRASPSGF